MANEGLVETFFSDPHVCRRILRQSEADYVEHAGSFIESVRSFGITSSRIFVDDFAIFGHEGLREAIEAFIARAPCAGDVPLESITVVQYARRGTCESDMARTVQGLRQHVDGMALFALRYHVDVVVHLYVQAISADFTREVADLVAADAFDRLALFFDYAGVDAASSGAIKGELERFCGHALSRSPKVRVGNFPFCLFPTDALKTVYRDAVSDLRGHVGAQRALVEDLQARTHDYLAPCAACRCRAACYAYTDIAEHPECASWLNPRRAHTVVFAGGSISRDDVAHDDDIVWVGPAEQGDMLAAVLDGFENILIIDGYFYTRFPCTTLEVMVALERGCNVFGASSIGALRAVELEPFGMVGMGYVYEHLRRQAVKAYHVVAQTYDEMDRSLTVPLIQVFYFLECAHTAGVVTAELLRRLRELAEGVHFTSLSFDGLFLRALARDDLDAEGVEKLREYYASEGAQRFDIKKQDARALLGAFRGLLASRPVGVVAQTLASAQQAIVGRLRARYPRRDDFTLPANWRHVAPDSPDRKGEGVVRDRRECPARETCARARNFMDGLGVLLADTTRYDAADSHILSAFFIPFYSLGYSPSSATGNGHLFDEALASAYMELVERLAACALDIRGCAADGLDQAPIPFALLPQFYNWGCSDAEQAQAIEDRGYVALTDIVAGTREFVPSSCMMFKYSGTDGFSAGNTLPEAVLYGLYELVERDTCQLHVVAPECSRELHRLRIPPAAVQDEGCRRLLTQLDDRGCEVVLFLLPNLFGLPCVMCHVYDRNRRIQCHGGIAVRSDFHGAVYAALHEACMQYITYFVGTRDDYRAFAPVKRARIAFDNARATLFDRPCVGVAIPAAVTFSSVTGELDHVLRRLTEGGIERILVADLSPRDEYRVQSVKVIVPGLELWFCPDYRPSPFFERRAARTARLVKEFLP